MTPRSPARPLVLASTSAGRRAVLARLGLAHSAVAPSFDESVLPEGISPSEIALAFACGKARSVESAPRSALVIGADQVLEHRGLVMRKAESIAHAVDQLVELSGSTHELHSAIAVFDTDEGTTVSEVVTVRMTMARLSRKQLARYAERARPVGSAGGYHYEHEGVALFEDVAGGDDSAIVGLPLVALVRLLRSRGLEPLDAR
jgi:septum formation protein